MNQLFKKIFSITALISVIAINANNVTPTVAFRSQGFHADRQRDAGEVGHTHLYDMESWYGTFDIGVGYLRSFKNDRIPHCLFGNDVVCNSGCDDDAQILVQGSNVLNRDPRAWLADYLYLNCNYNGSFTIDPIIQNVVVDLDFYLGLDEWVNGMYFRIYGPINWTKWKTRFAVQDPATVLTTSCSDGYFTPSGTEVLNSSLAQYFAGTAPASVNNITFEGLKWAKMSGECNSTCGDEDNSKTGFADLRAELGWNFLQDEDYHLGVGIHAAAPTGRKREAEFVLSPVIGNGNHWELGGTVHGHYVFWRSEDEEKHFGFYVDAIVTHLFKGEEQRTFDLIGKDNSRYMLATKFTNVITNGLAGRTTPGTSTVGSTPATSQFGLVYAPVANLTTTDIKVRIGAQADVSAWFNFTARGFSWDIGYDFWGRSCEKFDCVNECNPCNADSIFLAANANTWALKGDARMFGFAGAPDGAGILQDQPVALSATQNNATIHSGTNVLTVDPTLTNVNLQNGGVDNSQFAIAGAGVRLIHTPTALGGANNNSNQIKTSIQPIFIKSTDVALQGTKGLSNTVWTHLSYTWDRDNWVPYLGIGGSAEFGQHHGEDCDECPTTTTTTSCATNCDECLKCSLSQWAVWVKGGISFS